MSNIKRMTQLRLGEILLREGIIAKNDLDAALAIQQESGQLLGEVLVELGVIKEEAIAEALASQFGLPYLSTSQVYLHKELLKEFPMEFMRTNLILPLDKFGKIMVVLIGGMIDEATLKKIEQTTNCQVEVYICTRSEVLAALDKFQEEAPTEVPMAK
jgi:hypothetical protein